MLDCHAHMLSAVSNTILFTLAALRPERPVHPLQWCHTVSSGGFLAFTGCFQQLSSARPTLIKPCGRCQERLWKWVEQLSGFPVRGRRVGAGEGWGVPDGTRFLHYIQMRAFVIHPMPDCSGCRAWLVVQRRDLCVARKLPSWFLVHSLCLNYFLVWFNITFEVSKRIFDTWGNCLESSNPVVLHGLMYCCLMAVKTDASYITECPLKSAK